MDTAFRSSVVKIILLFGLKCPKIQSFQKIFLEEHTARLPTFQPSAAYGTGLCSLAWPDPFLAGLPGSPSQRFKGWEARAERVWPRKTIWLMCVQRLIPAILAVAMCKLAN